MSDYLDRTLSIKEQFENFLIRGFLERRIVDSLNGGNRDNIISRCSTKIYRIGFLNDTSVLLRIPNKFNEIGSWQSELAVENFCENSRKLWEKGVRNMPSFCLPVGYIDREKEVSYALLTEDLSDWGRNKFLGKHNPPLQSKREIKFPTGEVEEYYVDFGSRSYHEHSRKDLSYQFIANALDLTHYF